MTIVRLLAYSGLICMSLATYGLFGPYGGLFALGFGFVVAAGWEADL